MHALLEQTTRVAIAAYLHDLGKLAERANVSVPIEQLNTLKTLHCPQSWRDGKPTGKHTHIHAAYTSLAFNLLEQFMPDFAGQNAAPFTGRGSVSDRVAGEAAETDSLVNAAANHHKPDSFLQWIVAQADRIASGLDRETFGQYNQSDDGDIRIGERVVGKENIRQATLFEQLNQDSPQWQNLKLRYPLTTLNAQSIFPVAADSVEKNDKTAGQKSYLALWNALLEGAAQIPDSHRANPSLWLDHFDSLWLHVTQAVPSTTVSNHIPDVSLYDHSRTTAALASAIWRFHEETKEPNIDVDQKKCLLIQGDFFGIQSFVFADGAQSNKQANKLLRGRSFMVNLLTECAALMLLEKLELPPTSLVLNAAGKFVIVAHNTPSALAAIEDCRKVFNDWFLKQSFGEAGIGIATTASSTADFCLKPKDGSGETRNFDALVQRMVADLDVQKHRRFDLTKDAAKKQFDVLDDYQHGECPIQGRIPASGTDAAGKPIPSLLALDQIAIGENLVKKARIAIVRHPNDMNSQHACLKLDYFGYHIAFVDDESEQGKFGELAAKGRLVRLLDFSTADADGNAWHGYARRFVNTYAPRINELEHYDEQERYASVRDEDGAVMKQIGELKTLQHLALDDKTQRDGHWQGINAIAAVKGDIDNLGALFQTGLKGRLTFSRWASLSRQVHFFYSLWLPWACEHGAQADEKKDEQLACLRNTYTVFAGGDDFFLLGPWHSQVKAAGAIKTAFDRYMGNAVLGGNEAQKITFSAGIIIVKPDLPIRAIAHQAEEALELAKANKTTQIKNAVHLWHTVPFGGWQSLSADIVGELSMLLPNASTGIIYDLMQLAVMASEVDKDPTNALWRSKLAYRLTRYCEQNKLTDRYADISTFLTQAIQTHGAAFCLPLSLITYQQRS
jgi:CRISPR-associated protein Csm1